MSEFQVVARDILLKAFPGIAQREAGEMVSIAEIQTHNQGVTLCREGAFEYEFYIILDGRVQVSKVINTAENRVLKILEAGDFFGEMGLIHNAPRAATVITLDPTTVLVIHKRDFEKLLQRNSSVSLAMVREVSRRLRENDQMAIEDLRLRSGELAMAYQRLAQEDFSRREFLTTIAHEIRTPLTAACGYLEIALNQESDGAAQRDALRTVTRNLEYMTWLVDDLLFLQEVELVLPEMHTQDMGEVVRSAVDQLEREIQNKELQLQLDIANELAPVRGHFKSLEKAVTKVLDNAIKFSPKGGRVSVVVGNDSENVWTRVKDEGVGMPPEVLPKIFERFYHHDGGDPVLYGGIGLGLAITRQVLEQHGGRIDVKSEAGKGSVFTIILAVDEDPHKEYGM